MENDTLEINTFHILEIKGKSYFTFLNDINEYDQEFLALTQAQEAFNIFAKNTPQVARVFVSAFRKDYRELIVGHSMEKNAGSLYYQDFIKGYREKFARAMYAYRNWFGKSLTVEIDLPFLLFGPFKVLAEGKEPFTKIYDGIMGKHYVGKMDTGKLLGSREGIFLIIMPTELTGSIEIKIINANNFARASYLSNETLVALYKSAGRNAINRALRESQSPQTTEPERN